MVAKNYTMEEKVYLVTHVDDTLGFYNRFGYSLTVPNYRRARKKVIDTMNSAILLKELCKNAENKYQDKVQEVIDLKKTITEISFQAGRAQKRADMLEKENEKLKKEVKDLRELLEKKTDIFTKNTEGFTNRELVYRRIAQKYKEKCDTCPLRTKPKKIDGVWMD